MARNQVPSVVVRIFDDNSCSPFLEDGFFADSPDPKDFDINDPETVKEAVERHVKWANKLPTPFVLVYSDFESAMREGKRHLTDPKYARQWD